MNEQQFKEQILPLSRGLFGLCLKITGNHHEAKDVVQDVFLKLWATRESLTNIKNVGAFATTVARNQCLDKLRLRKPTVGVEVVSSKIESTHDDFEETENNEKLALISRMLTQLNEIQQKVFTMRDIENLEFSEIAQELEMTEENVRVTLSRARKKIREMIDYKLKQQTLRN